MKKVKSIGCQRMLSAVAGHAGELVVAVECPNLLFLFRGCEVVASFDGADLRVMPCSTQQPNEIINNK